MTSGPNTAKGRVSIKCPWCGSADPSEHLGADPQTGMWGCLRDSSHRGRHPAKLVMVLKGCSWAEAVEIVGGQEPTPGAETLEEIEKTLLDMEKPIRRRVKLQSLADFKRIRPGDRFWNYLKDRHFRDPERLIRFYQLCKDEKENRIILPLLTPNGIVGWQARSISKHARLRYLTHPAADTAKRVLFNHGPASAGRHTLVIVEGPFDTYKIDYYGEPLIRAVATLGTAFTERQIALLHQLCPQFERTLILFDPNAEAAALSLQSKLAAFAPVMGEVPKHREDAGDLRPNEVMDCIRACFD